MSGGLLFASFPSLNWHFLVWLALAPFLAALVSESRLRQAFLLGYTTGAVFLAGSCYWFVGVMERYGGLSPVLAAGVLVLFVVVFSTFFGAFGLAVTWMARDLKIMALALSPFLWVATEMARTYLITGFPWNLLGYAIQADGLRQLATYTAVYGLSFLAATTSALLVWGLFASQRSLSALVIPGWLVLLVAANWLFLPPPLGARSRVALLVQPNVPLDLAGAEHWAPWRNPAALAGLVEMSAAAVEREAKSAPSPPVIVWPENPAPFYFERDPIFRGAVERLARETHAYVVVGSVNHAGKDFTQPKNSAVVLDPEGRVLLSYDKIHLVPFGEYVPWWAFPGLVGKITHEAGNFVPGTEFKVARTPHGSLGVFICYEAIFPQLVRRLVPDGPGVLVNISNDAWFGDTAAAAQHLAMARLRSVENRRYILRATNDGITVLIDPYGRVLGTVPRHEQTVMGAYFEYRDGKTFYTRFGDAFAWLSTAIAAAGLALAAVKKRRQGARTWNEGLGTKDQGLRTTDN